MIGQAANSVTMSWAVAVAGANPIVSYNIYRNGAKYANTVATLYVDLAASNAEATGYDFAPPTYSYAVTAVDSAGNESPQQTQMTYWAYYNGTFYWPGDYSDIQANYADTSGAPVEGPFDISITNGGSNGYWQPYSGPPSVGQWALDVGAFNYFTITLKPTVSGTKWQLGLFSRVPTGDIYPYGSGYVILPGAYGPPSVAGQWATYKIPLSAVQMGKNSFTASISGNTMTVTSVPQGVAIEPAMWISGPGITANTYITANAGGNTGSGGVGTYNLNNAQTVPSETVQGQRTDMYKIYLDTGSATPSTPEYYADNLAFTVQ